MTSWTALRSITTRATKNAHELNGNGQSPPAEPWRDSFLEDSFLVQQPQNKPLRLDDRNVQTPQISQSQQPGSQLPDWPSELCNTSKPVPSNQRPSLPTSQQTNGPSPQPPKRKRGRPSSQPQLVEACTANSFSFQVSAARQSYLEKNRVVVHKCRMRNKEYINGLERPLEITPIRIKCGFWPVEEYLVRCVEDLLENKIASAISISGEKSRTPSLAISTVGPSKLMCVPSADLPSKWQTTESQYKEDHSGIDLPPVVVRIVKNQQPLSEALLAQSHLEKFLDISVVVRHAWYANGARREPLPHMISRFQSESCLSTAAEAVDREALGAL
ncbi:hypothetical protein DM02DRAFT_665430 [Periconia macrospinosa]|uniref:Uncharacterized protein n=1 Tax=Periconia macrospinosa TaxID=97972 RepID=A0A2V1CWV1_9PLEO|nr:hypothetical protein DM02DRAFT_665430 [Periconia macrospinosa]